MLEKMMEFIVIHAIIIVLTSIVMLMEQNALVHATELI